MSAGIYLIQCVPNDKLYVGSSQNVATRLAHHRGRLIARRHHNIHLQRAWDKYGSDAFLFQPFIDMHGSTAEELIATEAVVIRVLEPEFNIVIDPRLPPTVGGHRTETKIKIGLANKGGPGRPWPRSIAYRAKISASKRGKSNGRLGYKHTEETKQKMSESAKRRCRVG